MSEFIPEKVERNVGNLLLRFKSLEDKSQSLETIFSTSEEPEPSGDVQITKDEIHHKITQTIIETIESGVGPWELPWYGKYTYMMPENALTGKKYRGFNVIYLWAAAKSNDFKTGYWATENQWGKLGATLIDPNPAHIIVAFPLPSRREEITGDDKDDDLQGHFGYKSWPVYNADQTQGWNPPPIKYPPNTVENFQLVDSFIENTSAEIVEGQIAAYTPSEDRIQMPPKKQFIGSKTSSATECYYSTLFHELTHWTGTEPRCNRIFSKFGDQKYAHEELVAELGAAFLCADLHITNSPREDHAAYINEWLSVLKRDMNAIGRASGLAQKSVDYLFGFQEEH